MDGQLQHVSRAPFEQLATAPDEFLSSYDIAALNLVAATGLPGTETLDLAHCLGKLDVWADQVRLETQRHLYRFDARSAAPPSEFSYGNSLARFLCYLLLQVLQEDCGVRYNPAKKFNPDFCQPEDLFIHGIVQDHGKGGTCASMPVVYVAVGRLLGYPVYLVETRGHLFFRWDDPKGTLSEWPGMLRRFWVPPDRFNVEGAGEGIAYSPDSHYIQWPELWKECDFDHGRYLVSLTPRDELASFLIQRAECFQELGNYEECLKAIYYARKLCPDDKRYEWLHAKRTCEYDAQQAHQLEMIAFINERGRQREAARKQPLPLPPGRTLKIAYGRPIPANLPPGTPIRYVPPDQADPLPQPTTAPGMPLKAPVGLETYFEHRANQGAKSQASRISKQQSHNRSVFVRRPVMYEPKLGRFLSRDPLPEDGAILLAPGTVGALEAKAQAEAMNAFNALNSYAYVGNNPTNLTDPNGLFFELIGRAACTVCNLHVASFMETYYVENGYWGLDPAGRDDGEVDAMIHCVANCWAVRSCGHTCARDWWDSREHPVYRRPTRVMDLINNRHGRHCASQFDTWVGTTSGDCDTCQECCAEKLKAGELRVINPKHPRGLPAIFPCCPFEHSVETPGI